MRKIAIIGGGAAGLVSAISASRHGANVTLFEKNNRVGKKILATGNGRCNYTNTDATESDFNSTKEHFCYEVLKSFSPEKTVDFFRELGIEPKVESAGKVFPRSEQASSVLDVLRYEVERLAIEVVTEYNVKAVLVDQNGFSINHDRKFDAVILATGGKAMPVSGSDGSGYKLAVQFGHRLIEPKPALVQLKLEGDDFKAIDGVKIDGVATLYANGEVVAREAGDVLFTNYGVSGPPILQLSRLCARFNHSASIGVNLFPDLMVEDIVEILEARKASDKSAHDALIGMINKRLIRPVLKCAQIDPNCQFAQLSDENIKTLANILINWRFDIVGTKGWQTAQVTVGGIDTADIAPATLASYCMPGLYLCGEVLDVDARCGGFNLQWAWASGYIAGKSAASGEL